MKVSKKFIFYKFLGFKYSSRFLTAIRKSDVIARYGGEEFILIMPSKIDKEESIIAAGRIRVSIQNHPNKAVEI
jgi:diguanylate cyclase (GGDEF)-like protein